MPKIKNDIKFNLLQTGRELVAQKGAQYLTARKLSDASGCSVGTIYNQFSSMDEFIAEQNKITLTELYTYLSQIGSDKLGYKNINLYMDFFKEFVASHRQLWFLFYDFHLNLQNYHLSFSYRRKMLMLQSLLYPNLKAMFPNINTRRLKISLKVLETSLVALSAMAAAHQCEDNRSMLLLNTCLAGMMMLDKE